MIILFAGTVQGQPGWHDFTTRYYYTILDKKGKEISFKKNKTYRIMIGDTLYRSSGIPNDSLLPVLPNRTYKFDNYIRINDFSLRLSQEVYNRYQPLEIKIIHKKDTMYLNQTTGSGSGIVSKFRLSDKNKDMKADLPSDYTLQFLPGHYHFPNWAKMVWDEMPEAKGKIKFVNLKQSHFIISKTRYDSIQLFGLKYKDRSEIEKRAADEVVQNFTRNYFTVDKRIEPTKFENPALPFKEPYWDDALYPTKNKEVYFGRVRYNRDSLNENVWKYLFSIYNRKENTVRHWYPKKNPKLFDSGYLYPNPYTGIVYQVVWIKDKQNTKQQVYIPPTQYSYQSEDEGQTWNENPELTKMFARYNFEHIEFLDKKYALSYNRREVKHKTKKYNIKQITYYLLQDMKVVDSLKMPNDTHDFENYMERYNHYQFKVKDTIVLGTAHYDPGRNLGKAYYQTSIIKTDSGWRFSGSKQIYVQRSFPKTEKEKDTIDYRNFRLINKKELLFKNGSGTLQLKSEVADNSSNNGIVVLEQGNRIYLLDSRKRFTYISFDGGTSWYLYPKPLEESGNYSFLEVDDHNEISFFNLWKLYKAYYNFSLLQD